MDNVTEINMEMQKKYMGLELTAKNGDKKWGRIDFCCWNVRMGTISPDLGLVNRGAFRRSAAEGQRVNELAKSDPKAAGELQGVFDEVMKNA